MEPRLGQPRTFFNDESLQDLAESIAVHGLIQPITVRPLDHGYYQIIAGERRWRASRLAGLYEVPVTIIEADDKTVQELSLIENLQREDLTPLEEARGYQVLMKDFGLSKEEIAAVMGKHRTTVTNALRLLKLTPEVSRLLETEEISAGHAKILLSLTDPKLQRKAAQSVLERGLSVRQTEALAARLLKPRNSRSAADRSARDLETLAASLGGALGRSVRITEGSKRGRITLEYTDADDREALLAALLSLKGTHG